MVKNDEKREREQETYLVLVEFVSLVRCLGDSFKMVLHGGFSQKAMTECGEASLLKHRGKLNTAIN